MPVLPKHAINPDTYESTSLESPIGSGPYRVGKIDAGRSITFVRDENYWGRDLPVNRGRYNFDEIRYDYFREGSVMFDAFKSGQVDLWPEEDPRRWANGYDFPAIRDGRAVKREFDIGLPAGMTALVFNTRRTVFADARVREALIGLFDFEWINRTLYAGLYQRTQSYFERSILASAGRPADAREREILAPFPNAVKPAIMDGTYPLPFDRWLRAQPRKPGEGVPPAAGGRLRVARRQAGRSQDRPASSSSRSSPRPPRRRDCCCRSRATSSGSASR